MAKNEPKTVATTASVAKFLDAIEDDERRADCRALDKLMRRVTKAKPRLWGTSIVGYGKYSYRYASGREGDWPLAGFSPRKTNLTVYVMSGFDGHVALMKKLGKYKTGKSCLYVKRLSDVDRALLEQLVRRSVETMAERYETG